VSRRWRGALVAALAAVLLGVLPARAETLRVCLDENIPPYSVNRGGKTGGFDLAVSQAVAKALGRELKVQWFESKLDEDKSTTLDANALLSDGRCQLVAGYPLVKDALGKPGVPTARLPDFAGAKPEDRRRRVALGTLAPTRPYHRAPLAIVLRQAAARPIAGLGDLEGLKLGVEGGTLADAILMLYGDGRLVDRITHVVPGRGELFPQLERGAFDATLVPLRRFDAWRGEHPETRLEASGYYHRIGFNMGFVGLASEAALLGDVDKALGDLLAGGTLPALAEAAGMTYVAPRDPAVTESPSLAGLARD
jgi:ABC-type amino acid transport substrate-binding protein